MPELEINFGWVSNAQSLKSQTREVENATTGFARMIVNDVAVAASNDLYLKNRASLVSSVHRVALSEVSRMAMLISASFAQPDKYTGPRGQISLNGARGTEGEGRTIANGMSDTAKALGFRSTFDRGGTDIGKWPKRGKSYLKWKQKHGHPQRWWEVTGDLKDSLGDEEQYIHAWGPVSVIFRRANNQSKARAGMSKSFMMSGGGPLEGQSTSSNVQASITHGGRAGRISAEYQVGRLEVIAFGRINSTMLPGLAEKNMNPYHAMPKHGDGVAGLFPDDGPGGVRNKLLGRQATKRYALEPFVSFFLTRAIPNAIWRRTETLIASSGVRQAGKLN